MIKRILDRRITNPAERGWELSSVKFSLDNNMAANGLRNAKVDIVNKKANETTALVNLSYEEPSGTMYSGNGQGSINSSYGSYTTISTSVLAKVQIVFHANLYTWTMKVPYDKNGVHDWSQARPYQPVGEEEPRKVKRNVLFE